MSSLIELEMPHTTDSIEINGYACVNVVLTSTAFKSKSALLKLHVCDVIDIIFLPPDIELSSGFIQIKL